MLYTKYISRSKQKKKVLTIMNAPEMVLQGKSWRNRLIPAPWRLLLSDKALYHITNCSFRMGDGEGMIETPVSHRWTQNE